MSPIRVTLPGTPAPKGSMRCIGARGPIKHQLIEDNQKTQPWRDKLTAAFAQVRQHADPHQPIAVTVTFTLDRIPGHFGTGRNAARLNARAPLFPATKGTGDSDKLGRVVLDALEDAGVVANDAQVTAVTARKVYVVPSVEALSGPRPPVWAGSYRPPVDGLPHAGAVVRIYPDEQED